MTCMCSPCVPVDLEVGASVEMTAEEEASPERPVSAGRVGSDGESDSNDEAESELTIDMDADVGDDSSCQNNNVSEERKIQEYMSRKDTAVIFPEPVEPASKDGEDKKQGQSRVSSARSGGKMSVGQIRSCQTSQRRKQIRPSSWDGRLDQAGSGKERNGGRISRSCIVFTSDAGRQARGAK